MTIKEFVQMIDGKQYGYPQFTKEELQIAKDNGYVIVCGASDDLMEFYGAICDEGGCYDGGNVYFNRSGVSQDETKLSNCITALWCDDSARDKDGGLITWTYQTDIPHESFMIYEDGESYCKGIVFSIGAVR